MALFVGITLFIPLLCHHSPSSRWFSDRARDTANDEIVALKKVRMDEEFKKSGFPISALREITLLLSLNHRNVVDLRGVAVGRSLDRFAIFYSSQEFL